MGIAGVGQAAHRPHGARVRGDRDPTVHQAVPRQLHGGVRPAGDADGAFGEVVRQRQALEREAAGVPDLPHRDTEEIAQRVAPADSAAARRFCYRCLHRGVGPVGGDHRKGGGGRTDGAGLSDDECPVGCPPLPFGALRRLAELAMRGDRGCLRAQRPGPVHAAIALDHQGPAGVRRGAQAELRRAVVLRQRALLRALDAEESLRALVDGLPQDAR
mmetsp:Transcript_24130/g.69425  ORF Transcript_24130/g.69425 Transcript_24130/m.69425 type:complete len:216 (+) Transcript_24130:1648-2295(+)